jgi:4-hydroxy-tetrahydrodipicolinate reductase
MAIRIAISGCAGRMGSKVAILALKDSSFSITGAFEAKGHVSIGQDLGSLIGAKALGITISDDAKKCIQNSDVLIDFTIPEVTIENVRLSVSLKKPIIIGTTGLSDEQKKILAEAAKSIPMVFSPNMSLGVNLLFELAKTAASRLGSAYDVEIVEAHHHAKKDSPSGTAKRLAESIAEGRKQGAHQIPIHAIRAGDIVGDHSVIFAGPFERLELIHQAHSRDAFALGALRAAQFAVSQKSGLYDMSHVLKGN